MVFMVCCLRTPNIKYYNQHDLLQLVAALSEEIMKYHAYEDGNKRIVSDFRYSEKDDFD